MMGSMHESEGSGGESLIILQSLLCLLREKNLLTRADIEELCDRVSTVAKHADCAPFPCSEKLATAAADEMARIGSHIGNRYGGKHRKGAYTPHN